MIEYDEVRHDMDCYLMGNLEPQLLNKSKDFFCKKVFGLNI